MRHLIQDINGGMRCTISAVLLTQLSKIHSLQTLHERIPNQLNWIPLRGTCWKKQNEDSKVLPQPLNQNVVFPTCMYRGVVKDDHVPWQQKPSSNCLFNVPLKLFCIICFLSNFMPNRHTPFAFVDATKSSNGVGVPEITSGHDRGNFSCRWIPPNQAKE